MKKTVLKYGLISGAIVSVLMAATVPFADKIGFDRSMIIGYSSMVLAFLLVFFGIRSYRDTVGGGYIGFFKGLSIGILITLISSICYVITWEIIYFNFLPDFVDKYMNHMIESARASGASAEAIAQQVADAQKFKAMYSKPLYNAALTFLEPFPVRLVLSILSALILWKRRPKVVDTPDAGSGHSYASTE